MSLRTTGIANNHIYCARAGATIDGVLVSATAMPDYSPASNWTKLSNSVTTLQDTPVPGNRVQVMETVAGRQQLREEIGLGPVSRNITWTQQDADEIIDELRTMSGPIDTSAATDSGDFVEFTPFAGGPEGVKGWYQIQQYNHFNELVYMEVLWGELRLAQGVTSGNNIIAPQMQLLVFPNSLNRARRYRSSASV